MQKGTRCDRGSRSRTLVDGNPVGFRHRPGASLRTAVAEFCGCPGRESSVALPVQEGPIVNRCLLILRGILWCSLSWSETKTVICPLSRFLFAAFKPWRFRVLKATISGQESKPISPPRLRDPTRSNDEQPGPHPLNTFFRVAASAPRRSVKGFRFGRVTQSEDRLMAGLKLSCFDHFSSALQSVATFLRIICGENAVTDGPSTQRKTRCCGN